jgi:hypothetical protein
MGSLVVRSFISTVKIMAVLAVITAIVLFVIAIGVYVYIKLSSVIGYTQSRVVIGFVGLFLTIFIVMMLEHIAFGDNHD